MSNEITRLTTLKAAYSGNSTIQASIQAEIDRLTAARRVIPAGTRVQVISLGDVSVKTGNISVYADYLKGSGALTARGDAKIRVTNNSPTFLRVGDVSIPHHEGGYLYLNDVRVQTNTDIDKINQGAGAAAALSLTDRGNTPAPSVLIANRFDSTNPTYNTGGLPSLIEPEIQLTGDIDNLDGTVSVFNDAGSVISGGTIAAETVKISAGEDFVQNFVAGINNIGAAPASLWSSSASSYEQAAWNARWSFVSGTNDSSSPYRVSGSLTIPNDFSSTIAANNVFITAEILNINGRIQSGIPRHRCHGDKLRYQ